MILSAANPNVRIVEDDAAVQKYLATLFRQNGIVSLCYDSAEAFMAEDDLSVHGCVLVDLRLPGLGGAELIGWIGQQANSLPAIVISGNGTAQLVASCFRKGAVDFIEKPMDADMLLSRVRYAIERDAARRQSICRLKTIRSNYEFLTPRERKVMTAICSGLCSKQIAYEIGISTRTIEKHRARVMAKMYADSLAQLVRMACQLSGDASL